MARCRSAGDRRRCRGAGHEQRADRVRRLGAVPSSARALGGLPLGVARATSRWCMRRSRTRPSPTSIPIAAPGIARTPRSGPDEDVAARARALGRPGARPRRHRGGGRVPASARASSRPTRRDGQRAGARRRPSAKLDAGAAGRGAGIAAASPRPGPLDELQRAQVERAARARSRSPCAAAATRRRSCSRPPRRLETLDAALARETYLRGVRRGAVRRPAMPDGALREVAQGHARRRRRRAPPRAFDLLPRTAVGGARHGRVRRRRADPAARDGARSAAEDLLRVEASPTGFGSPCRMRHRRVGRREPGTRLPARQIRLARDTGALVDASPRRSTCRRARTCYAGDFAAGEAHGRGGPSGQRCDRAPRDRDQRSTCSSPRGGATETEAAAS